MTGAASDPKPPVDDVPQEGYAAALAHLPKLNPGRLAWLMELEATPAAVWDRVVRGHLPPVRSFPDGTLRAWTRTARVLSVPQIAAAYGAAGVRILVRGSRHYPARLEHHPEPPAVLFCQGKTVALERPTVAIVGTRNATGYGRDVARRMGRRLAQEGVVVVSGLATGIDLAAHRGALRAGTCPIVGVAGTGADVVYPIEGRDVWSAIAEGAGVLFTEAPLGAPPSHWRFPLRNRIMAGLADVVVIVESPLKGGSVITASHAAERGTNVLVVPGPVNSSASAGCNRLIADGCGVACDPEDVLVALGLCSRQTVDGGRPEQPADGGAMAGDHDGLPNEGAGRSREAGPADGLAAAVLGAVDHTPTSFERILGRVGARAIDVAAALYNLEAEGWVRQGSGWWERGSSPGST